MGASGNYVLTGTGRHRVKLHAFFGVITLFLGYSMVGSRSTHTPLCGGLGPRGAKASWPKDCKPPPLLENSAKNA